MGLLELLIALVLLLWLLGYVALPAGELIHVLLVIAIVLVAIRLVQVLWVRPPR